MNQSRRSGTPCRGWIWDIKKYALHDGPGIRTTVFFKGCPLTCLWCCNPESQPLGPDLLWIRERCLACDLCLGSCPHHAITVDPAGRRLVDDSACDHCGICAQRCPGEAMTVTGRSMEVDDVLREVAKDSGFYERSGGGLTLSGGEPLAQAEFAAELLRRYKESEFGENTAVETCGAVPWEACALVLPYTDLFLYDIKHVDSDEHRRLTGAGNEQILENVRRIAESGAHLIVRLPLIPGCNDSDENIRATAALARSLPGVEQIDVLSYHRFGEPKYRRLDRQYALTGLAGPSAERLARCRRLIEHEGLRVRIGG